MSPLGVQCYELEMIYWQKNPLQSAYNLELVSKELNHLAAILHVYAGGFEFYEVKKKLLLFLKKKMEILLHF